MLILVEGTDPQCRKCFRQFNEVTKHGYSLITYNPDSHVAVFRVCETDSIIIAEVSTGTRSVIWDFDVFTLDRSYIATKR